MKYLISGTHSGLGQFLLSELGGEAWDRDCRFCEDDFYDVIIHCAWPPRAPEGHRSIKKYFNDTYGISCKLLSLKHKKFVFISSVDVYSRNGDDSICEDSEISLDSSISNSGYHKLLVESVVQEKSNSYLIIRTGAILGHAMRSNTLKKIIECKNPKISLSQNSTFNYILQKDLKDFIKTAIDSDKTGIFNFVSTGNVKLSDLASKLNKLVKWGGYTYKTPFVSNAKVALFCSAVQKTSMAVVEVFLSEIPHSSRS